MVMQRRFILALAAALLMLLLMGTVAFADGPTTASTVPAQQSEVKPVCVDGYVINHREQPVDGSKMWPKDPTTGKRAYPYLFVTASTVDANGALTTIETVNVDEKGYFKFTKLPKDTKIVFSLLLPPGWSGIAPQSEVVTGDDGTFQLAKTNPTKFKWEDTFADNYCYRIVFKIKRLVPIRVIKWEEKSDGTVSKGEGWVITATPVNDPWAVTQVVTTTASSQKDVAAAVGEALLTLTPGEWSIAETVKPGWTPLTPSVVKRFIDPYEPVTNEIVFKNREPVCHAKIIVTKYGYGTDGNMNEVPLGVLPGWTFTVARADNAYPPITKVTGGDGRAVFDGLFPGVYKVTETQQAGWELRTGTVNPQYWTLYDCETVNPVFENKELGPQLKISGYKYFKAWVKPYQNTTVGLSGWEITAELVGDKSKKISTTTDALGHNEFSFDTLQQAGMAIAGASIKVCEEERDHWIAVTPVCVTVKFPYPVPLGYGGAVVNFTNVQDPPSASAATASVATAQVASSGSGCAAYHTVVRGDTLANISRKYGASANSIMRANGIRNADVIVAGRSYCIPGN